MQEQCISKSLISTLALLKAAILALLAGPDPEGVKEFVTPSFPIGVVQ